MTSTQPQTITLAQRTNPREPSIRATIEIPDGYKRDARTSDWEVQWSNDAAGAPPISLRLEPDMNLDTCEALEGEKHALIKREIRGDVRVLECRATEPPERDIDPTQAIFWFRSIPPKTLSTNPLDLTTEVVQSGYDLRCTIYLEYSDPLATLKQAEDARAICASVRWQPYEPDGHPATAPLP